MKVMAVLPEKIYNINAIILSVSGVQTGIFQSREGFVKKAQKKDSKGKTFEDFSNRCS